MASITSTPSSPLPGNLIRSRKAEVASPPAGTQPFGELMGASLPMAVPLGLPPRPEAASVDRATHESAASGPAPRPYPLPTPVSLPNAMLEVPHALHLVLADTEIATPFLQIGEQNAFITPTEPFLSTPQENVTAPLPLSFLPLPVLLPEQTPAGVMTESAATPEQQLSASNGERPSRVLGPADTQPPFLINISVALPPLTLDYIQHTAQVNPTHGDALATAQVYPLEQANATFSFHGMTLQEVIQSALPRAWERVHRPGSLLPQANVAEQSRGMPKVRLGPTGVVPVAMTQDPRAATPGTPPPRLERRDGQGVSWHQTTVAGRFSATQEGSQRLAGIADPFMEGSLLSTGMTESAERQDPNRPLAKDGLPALATPAGVEANGAKLQPAAPTPPSRSPGLPSPSETLREPQASMTESAEVKDPTWPLAKDGLPALTAPAGVEANAAKPQPAAPHPPSLSPGLPSPPQTLLKLHQEGWGQSLGQHLMWMAQHHVYQADLKVNPPHLGSLEVRLMLQKEQADVTFFSPDTTVREVIQSALPRLQEMLDGKGIQLLQASVADYSVAHQQPDPDAQSYRQDSWATPNGNNVESEGDQPPSERRPGVGIPGVGMPGMGMIDHYV